MMIAPIAYVEMLKDKTYEELLDERRELFEQILDFEAHRNEPIEHNICPTPETCYQVNLEYLGELCKLIAEKYNEEYI